MNARLVVLQASIVTLAWAATAHAQPVSSAPPVEAADVPATVELLVGVISPKDGSREVGFAHQDTIEFAFTNTDGTVGSANLRLDYRSDNGKLAIAAAEAKSLAADGAIAILGPVDSGSTAAVLAEHLELPVISALSTATSLTMPERDPWFFRMTLSDLNRMREYVTTLRRREMITPPSMILYDDSSAYGIGLDANMRDALEMPNIVSIPWSDPNILSLAATQPLPATLFVLGSSAGAVRLARQIDLDFQAHGAGPGTTRYVFVGADGALRSLAPPNSVTIGEPTLVDEAGSDIAALRRAYETAGYKPGTFQVTTYEAYQVLSDALRMLVSKYADPRELAARPIEDLRTELRDILESNSFASLEAWRTIRFRGGDVDGAPPVPVYKAESALNVIEIHGAKPFLEIDAPEQVGYLEGAVTVTTRAHQGAQPGAVTIKREGRHGREDIAPTPERDGDLTKLTFYPWLPGTYTIHSGLPTRPAKVSVNVRIGWAYPLAAVGALIGSLLFVLSTWRRGGDAAAQSSSASPFPWPRVALGVLTGLAIATLDLYRSLVPGGASLPTLADTKTLAAFWDGVAGGWIGPSLIVLLAGRLLPYNVGSRDAKAPPSPPVSTPTGTTPPVQGAPAAV